MITESLTAVRARIAAAARRAGRDPAAVTLVAVSKLQSVEAIREAYAAGQRDFGENYAQELRDKVQALQDLPDLRWHALGALQRNKVRMIAECASVFHAVDRREILLELEKRCAAANRVLSCFLEVSLVAEAGKAGLGPTEASALAETLAGCPHLTLAGLMCIPPPAATPEDSRRHFATLRRVSQELVRRFPSASQLSMGMTADFEVAIEEGATHVRIGTAIFGSRKPATPRGT